MLVGVFKAVFFFSKINTVAKLNNNPITIPLTIIISLFQDAKLFLRVTEFIWIG